MDASGRGGVLDLGVGGVGAGVAEVLAHGGVQQVGLLADDADDLGEVGEPELAHVDAVDGDPPARSGSYSRATSDGERALARAGLADQGQRRAGGDVEVDAGEGRYVVPGVGERDALEADVAADPRGVDVDRVGGLVDLDGQVEVLEDPRGTAPAS